MNLINSTNESDLLVINPDTIWNSTYLKSIIEMEKFYFNQRIKNILLVVNNLYCFDKRFNGDFEFKDNILLKKKINDFKFTGCQIINKDLLKNKNITYFPMSEIWDDLERENKLYGFEYNGEFLHLTDIEIYNKLFKSKN